MHLWLPLVFSALLFAIGVYGVVLDRWGSYRGEHPSAPDLKAVADVLDGWRRPS